MLCCVWPAPLPVTVSPALQDRPVPHSPALTGGGVGKLQGEVRLVEILKPVGQDHIEGKYWKYDFNEANIRYKGTCFCCMQDLDARNLNVSKKLETTYIRTSYSAFWLMEESKKRNSKPLIDIKILTAASQRERLTIKLQPQPHKPRRTAHTPYQRTTQHL